MAPRPLLSHSLHADDEPAAPQPQPQKRSASKQPPGPARKGGEEDSSSSSDCSSDDDSDSDADDAMEDDTAADPDASDCDDGLDEAARKAANVKALLDNRCCFNMFNSSRRIMHFAVYRSNRYTAIY